MPADHNSGGSSRRATGAAASNLDLYQVNCTFLGRNGEESAAPVPALIEIQDNTGILVYVPQPSDGYCTQVRVYVSRVNAGKLYRFAELPVGQLTLHITQIPRLGAAIATQNLDPMPAGTIVAELDARLYAVAGGLIFYSEPFYTGVTDLAENYIHLPEDVSIFLPCVDGAYIVADRTYWMDNANPKDAKLRVLSDDKAVPGTGVRLPKEKAVAWFGDHGWVVGKSGGSIEMKMGDRVAVDQYARGAALFREERGIRQLVSSLQQQTVTTGFVATDFADADIVRAIK